MCNDWLQIPTWTLLLLSPSRIVSHTIADQRHRIIEEAGGHDLADLTRRTRGSILPQDLHDAGCRDDMHTAMGAFHHHADPLTLPIVIEALTLEKSFDTGPHCRKKGVATNDGGAQSNRFSASLQSTLCKRCDGRAVSSNPLRVIPMNRCHIARSCASRDMIT